MSSYTPSQKPSIVDFLHLEPLSKQFHENTSVHGKPPPRIVVETTLRKNSSRGIPPPLEFLRPSRNDAKTQSIGLVNPPLTSLLTLVDVRHSILWFDQYSSSQHWTFAEFFFYETRPLPRHQSSISLLRNMANR